MQYVEVRGFSVLFCSVLGWTVWFILQICTYACAVHMHHRNERQRAALGSDVQYVPTNTKNTGASQAEDAQSNLRMRAVVIMAGAWEHHLDTNTLPLRLLHCLREGLSVVFSSGDEVAGPCSVGVSALQRGSHRERRFAVF